MKATLHKNPCRTTTFTFYSPFTDCLKFDSQQSTWCKHVNTEIWSSLAQYRNSWNRLQVIGRMFDFVHSFVAYLLIFLHLFRSANIGVFICLKCCGVHRSLGTHISKVLSQTFCPMQPDLPNLPCVSGFWNPFLSHIFTYSSILQVLSVTLDEWSDDQVEAMMEVGGNASANSIYEAYLPEGVKKPRPDAPAEDRAKYIRWSKM